MPAPLRFSFPRLAGIGGIVLCLLPCTGWAQDRPYSQQQVDHVIDVRLDDRAHVLRGSGTFTYHNNHPDALDTLWIHLWPNAYRDRSTALCAQKDRHNDLRLHFAQPGDRGSIDSLDFNSGGRRIHWGYHPTHPDIAWLALPEPLRSGEQTSITTPFRVAIPNAEFSRLGHSGQAYYITQWYPKPAVYNGDGWHAMPYLDQGEFYAEYGSYDVSITLPANYVVGATGLLQDNPAEEAWLDSLAALPLVLDGTNAFPASVATTKTLRFRQDDIHDFAWFADKRFLVRKSEVVLPGSGRTVTTCALFTPANAGLWADATTYLNASVRLFSEWVGDYRYAACTAVDGTIAAGGGMEYPMITIIGKMDSPLMLDQVIAHEVGHNWFQGMLASNERAHPWMDEGLTSFYEQRYMETRYPGALSMDVAGVPLGLLNHGNGFSFRRENELLYRYNARRNWDAPPGNPATGFSEVDYVTTIYAKSALVLDQLFHHLGPTRFDSCSQAYFNSWAGKHPGPADLRASYEQCSGQDLGWCFGESISGAHKPDVKARRLKQGALTYRSTAAAGFPFPVTAWNGSDSLGTVWISGKARTNTVRLPWPAADRVRIDAEARTLDIDRRNNEVRAYGLMKRTRLPALRFLSGVEREDRRSIYWSPAIGYNRHDGGMVGLALYNTVFPSQRLEWAAAPLYGLESGKLAGGARVTWSHDRIRSNWLRNMQLGVSGFAASLPSSGDLEQGYQRLVPSIQLTPRLRSTGPEAFLRYRHILIREHVAGQLRTPTQEHPIDLTTRSNYHEASINLRERNGFNPFSITLTSLNSTAFNRVSLDAAWSAIYDRHKHRLTFRAFAGSFLRKDRSLMQPAMGWRMHWGSSDLLYDRLYTDRQPVGRNTAVQFNKEQGGFKTPTAIGTSDTWIAALNMELDLPFALPLAAFASYGAAPLTLITQEGKTTDWRSNWEVGIGLRIWRDMAEVWIPLAFSQDIQLEHDLHGINFTDRIRIVLALVKMDPTQVLRQLPH